MTATLPLDTVDLHGGAAAVSQSLPVPRAALSLGHRGLAAVGDGYLHYLQALPLLALAQHDGGSMVGPLGAPERLPLLRFATPYLAASRGGHELRYPILGGLMAREPGGHLAFGWGPDGAAARLWIDVVDYRPRLGLGPLYLFSQLLVHRVITFAYLRSVARSLDGELGQA